MGVDEEVVRSWHGELPRGEKKKALLRRETGCMKMGMGGGKCFFGPFDVVFVSEMYY